MSGNVTSGHLSETVGLFHASNFVEQSRGMQENAGRLESLPARLIELQ